VKRLYFRPSGVSRRALTLIAVLSACLLFAVERLPVHEKQPYYEQKAAAAGLAAEAFRVIREERLARELAIDPEIDPARTGLIGTAYSPVTSNTGDLTSKRTANNPNFAAVLVQMLREAGVRRGDQVAVGVSGSFPGMNVAAYAALQTLEAKPLIIVSASASEFGANLPELLWLDMEKLFVDKNLFRFRAPAASRGGIDDRGFGMPEQGQALLDAAIERHGLRKVDAESLAEAIELRMRVYDELAQQKPIRAYLNVGGGSASVGTYIGKKQLKPGVNLSPPRGAAAVDSVMQRFLQRGVPVVHITQIISLARRYGLPVDPKITPKPGEGSVYVKTTYNRWLALAGAVIILLAMVAFTRLDLGLRLLGSSRRSEERTEPQQMI
jgi:poly-gamma-glutamate system protein